MATDTTASEATTASPSSATVVDKAKLGGWEIFSLLLALGSDLARPLGNYAVYFAIAGLIILVIAHQLRRYSLAKKVRLHAGFFTGLMAVIWGLQFFATPQSADVPRGATVFLLPALGPVQTSVLPLDPQRKSLLGFQDKIRLGSDSERVASARAAYLASEDSTAKRAMIEAMMESGNGALQQTAILLRLAERDGDNLALAPINRDADDALSRRLLSYSFRVRRVDVDSGGIELLGDGYGSNGTVSRQGIAMQVYIDLTPNDRRLMRVDLAPADGLRLIGKARLDSGEAVDVELPLF